MLRFLALAIPAALLVLAAVAAGAAALELGPDTAPLAGRGVARTVPLPLGLQVAGAAFEAIALVSLFLLIEGKSGSSLVDGLAAGLAAWLFRGPLLVLAIATLTRLPVAPFWQLTRVSLVALPAAGLVVGAIARWRRI